MKCGTYSSCSLTFDLSCSTPTQILPLVFASVQSVVYATCSSCASSPPVGPSSASLNVELAPLQHRCWLGLTLWDRNELTIAFWLLWLTISVWYCLLISFTRPLIVRSWFWSDQYYCPFFLSVLLLSETNKHYTKPGNFQCKSHSCTDHVSCTAISAILVSFAHKPYFNHLLFLEILLH